MISIISIFMPDFLKFGIERYLRHSLVGGGSKYAERASI